MIEQKSDAWFKQRLGLFTASQISEIMKKGRGKSETFSKTAISYLRTKIAERLTGQREEFSSTAMDWGVEQEPFAIKAYEALTGKKVTETGFHPLVGFEKWAGGSPDGLLADGIGICEIKCPYTSKMHVESLTTKAVPEYYKDKYFAQMQMNMICTDTQYCDFISFDPRMIDDSHKIVVVRVPRDEDFIIELLGRIQEAISFVKDTKLFEVK